MIYVAPWDRNAQGWILKTLSNIEIHTLHTLVSKLPQYRDYMVTFFWKIFFCACKIVQALTHRTQRLSKFSYFLESVVD